MAILNCNLYSSVGSLDKVAEEGDGVFVIFIKGYALVVIDSRDEGVCAEGNCGVKKIEVNLFVFSVDLTVLLQIMIPSSDAGYGDARPLYFGNNRVLRGDKLLCLIVVITAYFNEGKPLRFDKIESLFGIIVL